MCSICELMGSVEQTQLGAARADAFGGTTATATVSATGDRNIDGLLAGTKWASNSVTFSFTSSISDYEAGYEDRTQHSTSFSTLSLTQRAAARRWIGTGSEFYNVSNLSFTELTGASDRDATIRMAMSDVPSTAFAYYPANTVEAGDSWFNRDDYNNPVLGNYAYLTFGHEMGHALGLKHSHETGGVSNVSLSSNRDSMEFSIMSYRSYIGASTTGGYTNETWGYAQSLMMYDIRAIQEMYGAWFGYNSTNTTYTFSTTTGEMFVNGVGQGTPGQGVAGSNRIFRTIWDGNGTDTYDFSNYTKNLSIDLTPGSWSDLDVGGTAQRARLDTDKYARGHVFNALQYKGDGRSLIENAKGGSGNDSITGNNANNGLYGNGGNDKIYAGNGNDTVDGGNGTDLIYLGAGDDYVNVSSSGDDTFYGGTGNDYIYGYTGNETYYGEDGNDSLRGSSGNDFVNGGGGDDYMDGGSGIDTVDYTYWNSGGTYNLATGIATFTGFYDEDILNFENIFTGGGNDVVIGSAVANRITTNGGSDTINGGDGADTIYSGSGNDTVDGGGGADLIYLGSGDDYLNVTSSGDDTFYGGTGNDYVYGYTGNETYYGEDGNDTLLGFSGNDIISGGRGKDALTGGSGLDRFDFSALTDSLLASYDVITDYATGDRINAAANIAATTLTTSVGTAASLGASAISTLLTGSVFAANRARAFRVSGFSGTFVALNDASSGFNAATDSIIFLQNYALGSVAIV